ncbi:MAG: type secretion system protein [Firmicutes bacterium]|nr:type secretion system protein [Bacillota bacterium]
MSISQTMSLSQRLASQSSIESSNINKVANKSTGSNDLKARIHRRVVEAISKEQGKWSSGSDASKRLEAEAIKMCNQVMDDETVPILRGERQKIIEEIIDDVFGFGPIDCLLKDDSVSEVMVNSSSEIYVERKGCLEQTDVSFRDDTHVMQIIERIVSPIGRRIDESSPMVDARLPDGSRVNAIIPPLALKGPSITIRKFSKSPLAISDMVNYGSLTAEMADFLKACVLGKLNIMVAGGTGSGKTTTLNALSSFIPYDERIVTIEDAAELQLRQDHVVILETRAPNIEGKGAITIRDLVKNSLRMRPDRIVIGEVRGGEALDMLQAMNTGHEGSLTTAHANTPRDAVSRLETMVLMAGMELPVRAIREQISSAIDLIVQQSRLRDGSRRITHLTEVQGMESDVVVMQDIFTFVQKGKDENNKIIGEFKATGIRPKFLDKLSAAGINIPNEIFWPN